MIKTWVLFLVAGILFTLASVAFAAASGFAAGLDLVFDSVVYGAVALVEAIAAVLCFAAGRAVRSGQL